MVYNAKTQRGVICFLLFLTVIQIAMNHSSVDLLVIQFILLIYLIVVFFINFKFEINGNSLTYEMLFMTLPIYKKVVHADQITQIKFKRLDWANRGAIIQTKKGLNIRIINFLPKNVYEDLNEFSDKFQITLSKTKDFQILEKKV
ncbi:hypothetical protein [Bacillus solimangrovi]|uniref:DUF5673 domain-containing protein n=1 Tax=Bacillus solimangrovi TaxID=1305675 RepID=A0A1E5LE44_9BACI|nr:hypothetical protein [Bacillus solimangrovi]OEH92346.1 hypothetical protein BFG57_16355 [Bacillus solimangrovi]